MHSTWSIKPPRHPAMKSSAIRNNNRCHFKLKSEELATTALSLLLQMLASYQTVTKCMHATWTQHTKNENSISWFHVSDTWAISQSHTRASRARLRYSEKRNSIGIKNNQVLKDLHKSLMTSAEGRGLSLSLSYFNPTRFSSTGSYSTDERLVCKKSKKPGPQQRRKHKHKQKKLTR